MSWFGCFFLVTLPGTHARLLAVTWGKPVSGCFFRSLAGLDFLLGFLACWVWFCQLTGFASFFSFGHPSFGLFVDLNVRDSRVRDDG